MKRIVWLLLMVSLVVGAGCASKPSGSRQFIPGKGWVPTK